MAAEAEEHMVIGTLNDLVKAGVGPESGFWGAHFSDGEERGLALHPPGGGPVLLAERGGGAWVESLEEAWADERASGPSEQGPEPRPWVVVGPPESTEEFACLYRRRTGVDVEWRLFHGVYELESAEALVPPGRRAAGHLELATEDRLDLCASWVRAFGEEAGLPYAEPRKVAWSRLAAGALYAWYVEEGRSDEPVSMAAWAGQTPNGVRLLLVYTPPELRGRGFAGTAVHDLCRHLFDCGQRRLYLYTDLGNAATNRLYQRLGFRRVATRLGLRFPR